MTCPACGTDNPAGARFCNGCGAALAAACPACSHTNPPASRFCNACGAGLAAPVGVARPAPEPAIVAPRSYTPRHLAEKILAGRDALAGERKQVTVLFSDVVGSTELIRDRDPEDAQRLLDGAVERMMAAVHRYEGTVSRLMGDGLMAMFGAPVSHEDHAARACFAALAMQQAIQEYAEEARQSHGAAVQIRVGLNSGEVIVRLISDDLHMDYTAMGQTVHLASRLEGIANAGTIVVGPSTLALAEGFVEVRPLGLTLIRGLDQPIEVYELVGAGAARTRLQVSAGRGLTPFVGRQEERATIDRALTLAQAGQGQVVALVAEPGVGKSRLVWEVTHSDDASDLTVIQAGAVSYGQATSWLPVIDALRAYFQIEHRDDHAAMRDKVTGSLYALDPALDPGLPALLALLDVPVDDAAWVRLDPPQRRRATLEAVRLLLLRESQRLPLLLVFEDLHWIDSETQALLDSLVSALPTARVLLLVTYRPEYSHTWGSLSSYTQLRLDPLGEQGAEQLLDALLGADPSIRTLLPLLIERTQGTPLFLEESVRELVETGALVGEREAYRLTRPVEEIRVPATVQAVLAARIDRLPAEEKRLLQTAAVIGKDVPFRLLQAIVEVSDSDLHTGLSRLQAAELLYPTRLFPEPEYTFKHALTHDVAYGSLLQERRKALHARIVATIESLYPNRLDEHAERLAHHALRSEEWEQAVSYCRQAGGRAAAHSAYEETTFWLVEALRAVSHRAESQESREAAVDLRLALRHPLSALGRYDRRVRLLYEAEEIAASLADQERLGHVYVAIGSSLRGLGDYDQAVVYEERSLRIATAAGDVAGQVAVMHQLALIYRDSGRFREAIDGLRLCIGPLTDMRLDDQQRLGISAGDAPIARGYLAWSLAECGEFAEAILFGREAIRIGEQAEDLFTVAVTSSILSRCLLERGDITQATPLIERGMRLARTNHLPNPLIWSTAITGTANLMAGRSADAVSLLEEATARASSTGVTQGRALWATWLAEAYLAAGRIDDARSVVVDGFEYAVARHERHHEAYALRVLAEVAAHGTSPDLAQAEVHYRAALALAEDLGMRPLQAHCHLGLGKLYRRIGRLDEARAELATAVAMLREMEMTFWLPETEAELASALAQTT